MPTSVCFKAKDGHLIAAPGQHKDGFFRLDEEIARHFGDEPDNELWYYGWYDSIALMLALGKTLYQIEQLFLDDQCNQRLIDIVRYLKENYDTDAWYEIKAT